MVFIYFFFFKQKTAYDVRISDWSSDVCSSDLPSYPHWRLFDGYSAWRWSRRNEDGVDTHRCPVFIPSRVSGGTRILHYASFAASAAAPALKLAYTFRQIGRASCRERVCQYV